MSAQSDFLKGMHGFRLACQHQDLIEKAPGEENHNLRSKVLRNGIAIIGFSTLEHFIRTRTGEILHAFDKISIPFEDLPDRMKKMAINGAIKGVSSRMKYEDDAIAFVQSEASIVASSLSTTYRISRYSIGWDGSNLRFEDIGAIFKCFNIDDGWGSIVTLSKRLNLAIPSSKDSFNNATRRRHDAAHNIDAVIHPQHLNAFIREAYAIAVGFDALISTAFRKIHKCDSNYLTGKKKVSPDAITFRIIKSKQNKWKEYREGGKKAIKVADTKSDSWTAALSRASTNNEILLCMDSEGFPDKWELTFLPC